MANPQHLEILERGVEVWNEWRKTLDADYKLDLSNANLSTIKLSVDYPKVPDSGTRIAYMVGADLGSVNLKGVDLRRNRTIGNVNFSYAKLDGANFNDAFVVSADFTGASLIDTNFGGALLTEAKFTNTDLSKSQGLETVRHFGPSFISVDTLYKSGGNIPECFLRGCDVPDKFIIDLLRKSVE